VRDGLLVRPSTAEDEAFARDCHHVAFRDVVERQFGPWDEARQDAFFATAWRTGRCSIVELDGVRCGYLVVADLGDAMHVGEIVLHPDFHGRGLGTELLEDVFRRGKPVRLGVLFENHRARALYERLGFREIGRDGAHALMQRDAP
jgi:ribosomal protein S18 acetylase RimI-like enzyme